MIKITPWAIGLLSVMLIVPTAQAETLIEFSAQIQCSSESKFRFLGLPSYYDRCIARVTGKKLSDLVPSSPPPSFTPQPLGSQSSSSSNESYNDYVRRTSASENAARIESRRREQLERAIDNIRYRRK